MMSADIYTIKPVARMRSDYKEKFGIPRQSGLVPELKQEIVIEPEFRNVDAVRGILGFSYLWLIWGFSKNALDMTADPVQWSPTVRPPRLGGEVRMGVWATRSPYRPNSLGLSSVRLEGVTVGGIPLGELRESGETAGEIVLTVSGADLLDGTPIYDIKPYIPYADSHPEASAGFTASFEDHPLTVVFPDELIARIDRDKRAGLLRLLSLDPRGAYEKQPGHTYGLSFADHDVKFTVEGNTLTVTGVEEGR